MYKWLKNYRVRIRNIALGLLIIGLLIIIFFVIYGYFNMFGNTFFPSKRDELGQFGDYFGGALNPIFGFASFLALLITIVYQAKELNASTKELKNSAIALSAQNKAIELQRFEQTFFAWLNTYRDLLSAISGAVTDRAAITQGRTHIYDLWNLKLSSSTIHKSIFNNHSQPHEHLGYNTNYTESFFEANTARRIELIAEINQLQVTNLIKDKWQSLYETDEHKLDSLFRTAYKLLTWIDSQDSSRLSVDDKWLYISIFRSQLSWIEMVYFYYNGLTSAGKKFKPIIEKYALFDNLKPDSDVSLKILRLYLSKTDFYKDAAFNSEDARKNLAA